MPKSSFMAPQGGEKRSTMYFATHFLNIFQVFCIKSALNTPIWHVGPSTLPPSGSKIFPNQSRYTENHPKFDFLVFFFVREKRLKFGAS